MASALAPDKNSLRRDALARRAEVAQQVRAQFSERLARFGVELAQRLHATAVSAYYPIRDEPDTLALLGALASHGFRTLLPITGARGTALVFRLWKPGEATVPGQMSIPEPPATAPALDPDLMFVPLACFDRRGHRIGYGAGYYDRSLARLRARKPIRAVGVAYGVCEVASVPYEAHDQTLDAVVTEQDTIFFGGR